MLSAFIILIAGCDHNGAVCAPLTEERVEVASLAECEALIDGHLAIQTAPWPVYTGLCQPESLIAAVAR
ncbi:MAG: hypothetical protein AAGI50_17700 [Pseudomonadota bacterium]